MTDWDSIWKEKKHVTDFSIRWNGFLTKAALGLKAGARVLEAGCGSGEGIAVLAKNGNTTVGLDISGEALARTRIFKAVHTVQGDNFYLPFQDDTFDLVFNSGVIEHFPYPNNVRQLKEMARVTKRGGKLIINVPNALCLWYLAVKKFLMTVGKWQFGYEEGYTPWRLKKAAGEAGLSVVDLTGFLFLPPLATNRSEALPLRLRNKLALIENYMPFKEYYCYSVCIICRKE